MRRLLLAALLHAAMTAAAPAHAQPAEVIRALPQAQLAGTSRFTFLGFPIYEARLWIEPGFRAGEFANHPLGLELGYMRDFTGESIAQQSIKEMRRSAKFGDAQAAAWQRAMQGVFPDVRRGDRITGLYSPGTGATFVVNGKPAGEIRDAEFARLFFGIWLSPNTSEPGLRRDLLAQAPP